MEDKRKVGRKTGKKEGKGIKLQLRELDLFSLERKHHGAYMLRK